MFLKRNLLIEILPRFLWIIMPIWYFNCRIEERQMMVIHGEKYFEYKKNVGMFFPKFMKI